MNTVEQDKDYIKLLQYIKDNSSVNLTIIEGYLKNMKYCGMILDKNKTILCANPPITKIIGNMKKCTGEGFCPFRVDLDNTYHEDCLVDRCLEKEYHMIQNNVDRNYGNDERPSVLDWTVMGLNIDPHVIEIWIKGEKS